MGSRCARDRGRHRTCLSRGRRRARELMVVTARPPRAPHANLQSSSKRAFWCRLPVREWDSWTSPRENPHHLFQWLGSLEVFMTNPDAVSRPPLSQHAPTFLSTEHWGLLGTRSMVWNEAFSRVCLPSSTRCVRRSSRPGRRCHWLRQIISSLCPDTAAHDLLPGFGYLRSRHTDQP
jgi:hypothetical protein